MILSVENVVRLRFCIPLGMYPQRDADLFCVIFLPRGTSRYGCTNGLAFLKLALADLKFFGFEPKVV